MATYSQALLAHTPSRRKNERTFPCPVYGEIELPEPALALLHTKPFQRLRELKQLGACCYVFPAATHTRYEHSMGVCHLAFLMAKQLCKDDEVSVMQVACAGLAHDLGHGPLSHLFEDWMNSPTSVGYTPGSKWSHEAMSERLLDIAVEEVLETSTSDKVCAFFQAAENVAQIKSFISPTDAARSRDPTKSFLYDIVANNQSGLDTDKMDYINRDIAHTGISIAQLHTELILKYSKVAQCHNGSTVIAFRNSSDVIRHVNSVFRYRSELHLTLYQNKDVTGYEEMIRDILNYLAPVLKLRSMAADPHLFLELDDTIFTSVLRRMKPEEYSDPAAVRKAQETYRMLQRDVTYRFVQQLEVPAAVSDTGKLLRELATELPGWIGPVRDRGFTPLTVTAGDGTLRFKVCNIHMGANNEHPLTKVKFYDEEGETDTLMACDFNTRDIANDALRINQDRCQTLLVRLYIHWAHRENEALLADAKRAFEEYFAKKWPPAGPTLKRPRVDGQSTRRVRSTGLPASITESSASDAEPVGSDAEPVEIGSAGQNETNPLDSPASLFGSDNS